MSEPRITVIGGANVDVFATSDNQLILYDSNPGTCNVSFGGVGRNIAENLCRLGHKIEMITVLSDDVYSEQLTRNATKTGIDLSMSLVLPGRRCSTYTSINDPSGELVLAVSDMDIYDCMTPDFFEDKLEHINSSDIVILDTNLPEDVLRFLAENVTAPMLVDPVSTRKAVRIRDFIGRFDTVKPNIYEAEQLANMEIRSDESIAAAAALFISKGVRNVFISLGERGVYYDNGTVRGFLAPNPQLRPVNVAGCGDAFLAAVAYARLKGADIRGMSVAGVCAATISSLSLQTVSSQLTPEHLTDFISNYSNDQRME